ncbi:hypothetical protein GPL15_03910 [Clostridium sp. MCC353]|uniref:hypothetical protein n=1 Tax=Clostridium sp. MCC353 TaxID=2592646 RepID=UPI001C037C5E|nr:hypothetical protein [Clostridium sp. MCC353]MBT9775657.1 hypothetical protein [Clostridium sp. MCC353]
MILNLLAYIIIPGYTILFVKGYNWFTTNFSVIGNIIHRKDAFVLWGILVGAYFYYTLNAIVRRMKEKPGGTFLIPFSLGLLFCAITTPYLPDELPLKSFLHIIFAFLAAACLVFCLFLIIWQLWQTEPETYRPCMKALLGITAGSGFLLVLVGIVSSALEIFFTISTVILVRRLLRLLSQGEISCKKTAAENGTRH